MPYLLLQVTRDYSLSSARAAILTREFSVRESSLSDAGKIIKKFDFDGVVLCSSLSPQECLALADRIAAYSPSALVFCLTEQVMDGSRSNMINLPAFSPHKLNDTILEAFAERGRKPPQRVTALKQQALIRRAGNAHASSKRNG